MSKKREVVQQSSEPVEETLPQPSKKKKKKTSYSKLIRKHACSALMHICKNTSRNMDMHWRDASGACNGSKGQHIMSNNRLKILLAGASLVVQKQIHADAKRMQMTVDADVLKASARPWCPSITVGAQACLQQCWASYIQSVVLKAIVIKGNSKKRIKTWHIRHAAELVHAEAYGENTEKNLYYIQSDPSKKKARCVASNDKAEDSSNENE